MGINLLEFFPESASSGGIPANEGFTLLPDGWYQVAIVNVDIKDTREGNGKYIAFELKVLDGDQKGASITDRCNIVNENEKAVSISKQRIGNYAYAVGATFLADTDDLMDRPFGALIVIENDRKNEGRQNNTVKIAKPINEVPAFGPVTTATAQAPARAVAAQAAPRIPAAKARTAPAAMQTQAAQQAPAPAAPAARMPPGRPRAAVQPAAQAPAPTAPAPTARAAVPGLNRPQRAPAPKAPPAPPPPPPAAPEDASFDAAAFEQDLADDQDYDDQGVE